MQTQANRLVSGFGSLDSPLGWRHADVDESSLRSIAHAVRAILVISALNAGSAVADTLLPPVTVTPGPDIPLGPSGGGGGGGANYPTEGPQGPVPTPFDCATHLQIRPPACQFRTGRPGGSRYTGHNEPDSQSALGRIFGYLDSGRTNIAPISRQTLENALALHTQRIAEGQMTRPGIDLGLYEDLVWACEAQVTFDPEVYPDPVPSFIGETRLFNDTAHDCFQAVYATRSELGLEGASMLSEFLDWLGQTLSSITGLSVTATVNVEGSVGPVTMSLESNVVNGSLRQKWADARDDVECAIWYETSDQNGCDAQ